MKKSAVTVMKRSRRVTGPGALRSFICFCMLTVLCLPAFSAAAQSVTSSDTAQSAGVSVPPYMHLPEVKENAETSSGLETTWSCVYFGSYPSAEVVDHAWSAVDEYALQDGDVILDDALFDRLEALDEEAWQNDAAVLDGVSYLRVTDEYAQGTSGDAQEINRDVQDGGEQHYRKELSRPYHYFLISPIRWRVLDIQDGQALLLADRMPDCVPFHAADEDVCWGESTLRSWLNGYDGSANLQGIDYSGHGFMDLAFTSQEREAIILTDCRNLANQDYGTDSGADTEEYLFILSNEEVFEGENAGRYGFHPGRDFDDPAKRFTSTLYAKYKGAWWSPVKEYAGNSFWCMRTSGYTPRSVTYICDFGYIYSKGTLVTCADAGVLPAMWIDLSLAEPEDAGEVSSTRIIHKDQSASASSADDPAASEAAVQLENPVMVQDPEVPGGEYTIWNTVEFGHYPQTEITGAMDVYQALEEEKSAREETEADTETTAEAVTEVVIDEIRYVEADGRWFRCDPIIWRVLEVSDGTALLFSDKVLDCVPYHTEYEDVFWEASDLREWLNETEDNGSRSFAEMAFTPEELQSIQLSLVPNENNYYFGTACGSGTHDRIFLLSEAEVFCSEKAETYGFRPSDAVADPGRRLTSTAYAAARGVWQSDQEETEGNCFWLLRTNGYTRDNVVYVGEKGYLYNRGIPVTCPDAGIVPALRVDLRSAQLQKADE